MFSLLMWTRLTLFHLTLFMWTRQTLFSLTCPTYLFSLT
jgi:hypothetical protein